MSVWVPFVALSLLFGWVCIWLGALVPWSLLEIAAAELTSPTGDINVTSLLAIFVAHSYTFAGLDEFGLRYAAKYLTVASILALHCCVLGLGKRCLARPPVGTGYLGTHGMLSGVLVFKDRLNDTGRHWVAKCLRMSGGDHLHPGTVLGTLEGDRVITLGDWMRDECVELDRARGVFFTQEWSSLPAVMPVASGVQLAGLVQSYQRLHCPIVEVIPWLRGGPHGIRPVQRARFPSSMADRPISY